MSGGITIGGGLLFVGPRLQRRFLELCEGTHTLVMVLYQDVSTLHIGGGPFGQEHDFGGILSTQVDAYCLAEHVAQLGALVFQCQFAYNIEIPNKYTTFYSIYEGQGHQKNELKDNFC